MGAATATKPTTAKKTAPRKPRAKAEPTPEPTIDVVTLDAATFGRAFLNVSLFRSRDETRLRLCAVAIEVYSPTAVRLIATDSYTLAYVWVGDDEPALDVLPQRTVLALDERKLAEQMCRSLTAKRWYVSPAERPTVALDFTNGVALSTTEQSVRLAPVEEELIGGATYPNWRSVLDAADASEGRTGKAAFNPQYLARFTRIKLGPDAGHEPLVVSALHALKPTRIEIKADPTIRGLIMPVRVS